MSSGRLSIALVLGACHAATPSAGPDAAALEGGVPDAPRAAVPWTTGPITLDGEWSEPDWNGAALQLVFVDHAGAQARPYSELRVLRDATTLYVGLYAADEDIDSEDFFQITANALDARVDPKGRVVASAPGVGAASEVEGTIDQPSDLDEEWFVEAAIPLSAIGGDAHLLTLTAARCDVPPGDTLRCGAATAMLGL